MNHLLKITIPFCLGLLICAACGNSNQPEQAADPAKTTDAPQMKGDPQVIESSELTAKVKTKNSAETAVAPQTEPATSPNSTAATRKDSKTVHLPPTKTKVDTEPGKSRTYKLTLAQQAAGSWRNVEDIKELLVISDNQMIRMYNNKVVETVTFQMYQDCPKSCLGKEERERGLNCISIAEKNGDQCYLLLEMDRVKMHYRIAGTGKIHKYKRQF